MYIVSTLMFTFLHEREVFMFLHLIRILWNWCFGTSRLFMFLWNNYSFNFKQDYIPEGWLCRNCWKWKILVASQYSFPKLSFSAVNTYLPFTGVTVRLHRTQNLLPFGVLAWIVHLLVDSNNFPLPTSSSTGAWTKERKRCLLAFLPEFLLLGTE